MSNIKCSFTLKKIQLIFKNLFIKASSFQGSKIMQKRAICLMLTKATLLHCLVIDKVITIQHDIIICVYNRPYIILNNAKCSNFGLIFNLRKINIFQRLTADRNNSYLFYGKGNIFHISQLRNKTIHETSEEGNLSGCDVQAGNTFRVLNQVNNTNYHNVHG